jgi:hypothetical protein
MKHPPEPFNANYYLRAGEVFGVYTDKKVAQKLAEEKNARKPHGLYAVHAKRVKDAP